MCNIADNLTLGGVASCAFLNTPTRGRDRRAHCRSFKAIKKAALR
jgi:hypothetical protein